jgi:hypothetical protein
MATTKAHISVPVAPMPATLGMPPLVSKDVVVELKWDGRERVRGFLQVMRRELARVVPVVRMSVDGFGRAAARSRGGRCGARRPG